MFAKTKIKQAQKLNHPFKLNILLEVNRILNLNEFCFEKKDIVSQYFKF